MTDKSYIKIGSRGSQLALVQARMVAAALRAQDGDLEVEIVEIKTSGDWKPEQGETRLSEAAGGKGQFAKEIEQALVRGEIDIGVHSAKDMDSHIDERLMMRHFMPREDPADAFISAKYKSFDELREGAVVGTASVRRQAYTLHHRPDIKVVPLRGNVPTRLNKLKEGQVDATFLAVSGLNRLGLSHEITCPMPFDRMLPGAGQGALGLEIRRDDNSAAARLDGIICAETTSCVLTERAALAVLDGSCHTPIGAYASLQEENIHINVEVLSLDGQNKWAANRSGPVGEAEALGRDVGEELKAQIPSGILT